MKQGLLIFPDMPIPDDTAPIWTTFIKEQQVEAVATLARIIAKTIARQGEAPLEEEEKKKDE